MAEVTRSPFDLRSWQGLTAVLKAARESSLSPDAYAMFRNLVLEYAQKGGDVEIKKQIDAIILTFTSSPQSTSSEKNVDVQGKEASHIPTQGRRITPVFKQQPADIPVRVEKPIVSPPVVSIGMETKPENSAVVPSAPVVSSTPPAPQVDVPPPPKQPESFKTLEEHRVRITEIKRRVNALVGNPVTLMDKGNGIGRKYMSSLLTALKATSPGATLNSDEAMQNLETAFTEILSFTATVPQIEEIKEPVYESESAPHVVDAPLPVQDVVSPSPVEDAEVPKELSPEVKVPPPERVKIRVVPMVEETKEEIVSKILPPIVPDATPDETASLYKDAAWNKDTQETTKNTVQNAIDAVEESHVSVPVVRKGRRSFIPSLLDIEEKSPHDVTSPEENAWHAHVVPDELSSESVMRRPESPVTGITLGTPQSELMSQEVTAALVELLHEWRTFASSGLFGMGPGGIEHPVYQQIANLTMGEVLSGRWNDANPKVARSVKDYVDAWRHEQAVSYSPTETFEHYLRRVAQRIMKRQHGEMIVS